MISVNFMLDLRAPRLRERIANQVLYGVTCPERLSTWIVSALAYDGV